MTQLLISLWPLIWNLLAIRMSQGPPNFRGVVKLEIITSSRIVGCQQVVAATPE